MLSKTIGKEIANDAERESFLKDNCDKVEAKGYMKRYTPTELQEMKEKLAELSISIHDLDEEKKLLVSDIKFRIKPLKKSAATTLASIKSKAVFVNENCFKFIDQDSKMVGYYNADGDLVDSRPLNADELQGTIFQITRQTGTDN